MCNPNTCSQDCALYCGGGNSCDVGDCNTCINGNCAAAACDTELQACDNVPQCWPYVNCVLACPNQGCINQCATANPNGVAPGQAAMNCLLCDPATCSQDCGPYCPWP
jgi:hypothetical protein